MWTDILKIGVNAKSYIEEIMSDGEEWTIQEIMDEIPKRIKIRRTNTTKMPTVGKHIIPTKREIETYLNQNGYIKRTEKRTHPLALPNDRGAKVPVQVWRKNEGE